MQQQNTNIPLSRHERDSKLDHYYRLINNVILARQDAITGLLPASTAISAHGDYTDAWVRDNVYSIMSAWGLGLAYHKSDNDNGRAYLLEQSVVKLMRGLLMAMMKQSDKVERFKYDQSSENALHAKYHTQTGTAVVGDNEWGHLQLDATSLYILMLAQMTASGLKIVYTLDEVDFVQNLVHYIGRAYRTPDYGIWERGNKINHGLCELNASSIGMAKAALEAIRELNLFGADGGSRSIIHVVADEIARTRSTLESLLPHESGSKETDAALLSIIGFPAFAVDDPEVAEQTYNTVINKLHGQYGCKRFLLDGHQTASEDAERLHYEPHELKQFEGIESEWPLFFTYLYLDALFKNDQQRADEYRQRLDHLTIEQDGYRLLPELYFVPEDKIEQEQALNHSQLRQPNENIPLVWAQSLYYLGSLIQEDLLSITDIDPLDRHLHLGQDRSTSIQISLISENNDVRNQLTEHGIMTQSLDQVAPIKIRTARELAEALHRLGKNNKLHLSGRPLRRIRSLTTSQVFRIGDDTVVFLPEFSSQGEFYLNYDNKLLVEQLKNELLYHQHHWDIPGKPLITLLITAPMLHQEGLTDLIELIEQLQLGEINDVPVRVGRLSELISTSSKKRLEYLDDYQFSSPPKTIKPDIEYSLKWNILKTRPLSSAQTQLLTQGHSTADFVERLNYSDNPYQQIKILEHLLEQAGLDFNTGLANNGDATIKALINQLYSQSAKHHIWSVVRQAAALLEKHDSGLEDAVTELIIRQKVIDVGRSYTKDALIKVPMTNDEILLRINKFGGNDKREHILTEELLLSLGTMIKAEPELFENILTLRVNHLITLLTHQIGNEYHITQDEAFEALLQLRPYEIQMQLKTILADFSQTFQKLINLESLCYTGTEEELNRVTFKESEDPEAFGGQSDWLSWREHNGVISRMPNSFYINIWNVLGHCRGIIIGNRYDRENRLDSELQAETTANEKNFALKVEKRLSKIRAPEYRHLSIEALTALGATFKTNPDLKVDGYIIMDVIIGYAVRLAWLEKHPEHESNYEHHKADAWKAFYKRPPHEAAHALMEAFVFLLKPGKNGQEIEEPKEEMSA